MNDQEREALDKRWDKLAAELQVIHEGRVVPGTDPATREQQISEEMNEIELRFELDDDLSDD